MQSTGKRKVVRQKQKELELMTQEAGDPETLEEVQSTNRSAHMSRAWQIALPGGSSMWLLSLLP